MKNEVTLKLKKENLKKQQGFTLVELLIYIGLLMVMLLIFTEILTTIIESQIRSTNTSNVADDGRYIYSRLIYDVGRAEAIIDPSYFGSTSAKLELKIDGNVATYSATNGTLELTDTTGTRSLSGYGTRITDLLFTKVGSSSAHETVRLNFTITGNVDKEGVVDIQDFQTTVGLR